MTKKKPSEIWEGEDAQKDWEARVKPDTIFDRFNEKFPNSRGIFYNDDPYNSRRNAIKSFIRTELSALAKECIGIDQNILISVQSGKISTGRAVELLRADIIEVFKKQGVIPDFKISKFDEKILKRHRMFKI